MGPRAGGFYRSLGDQILMVRSADPVANHSLVGSTAIARTHPRCPEITRIIFHGACHSGLGTLAAIERLGTKCVPLGTLAAVDTTAVEGAPARRSAAVVGFDALPALL